VQRIAAWLVARPQNAVLGLAASMMLPFSQVVSGTVLAFLVLQQGPVRAMSQAFFAAGLLAAIALLTKASALQVIANGVVTWFPVLLLAGLLRHWRSVNLALQVSVIVAVLIMLAFFIATGDPTEFWKAVLTELSPIFAELGFQEQADALLTQQDLLAPQMTILVTFTSWSMVVGVTLLGLAVVQRMPGQDGRYGRFRDFSFGRVLAIAMAVVSLLAMVSGATWLQNIAFLLFAVFWVQGLAIAHWLRAESRIPGVVLVMVYILLPLLNIVMILGLAIAGYADAWFDYRRRLAA
jgi:hypothetical protein